MPRHRKPEAASRHFPQNILINKRLNLARQSWCGAAKRDRSQKTDYKIPVRKNSVRSVRGVPAFPSPSRRHIFATGAEATNRGRPRESLPVNQLRVIQAQAVKSRSAVIRSAVLERNCHPNSERIYDLNAGKVPSAPSSSFSRSF